MPLLRINRHPNRSQLRVFAAAWFAFAATIAVVSFGRGHPVPAGVAVAVGSAGLLSAWWLPALTRWGFLALSYATYPLGFVLSYVVLGVLYFGVLVPIGLLLRLLGRDPLQRAFQPQATSYWIRRDPPRAAATYLRQH